MRRRELTSFALLFALVGCSERTVSAGKRPENPTRELEASQPPKKPDRQAAYDEREERLKAREAAVERPATSEARIGVVATKRFHRSDCPLLKDVPTAEQIRFTSLWDGIDAGFSPCNDCRAGTK